MKNIISFLLCFTLFYSYKGQDKEEKKHVKSTVYFTNCKGEYSTGEKLSERDKKWSLNTNDIDKIMSLSSLITEN